MVTYVEVEDAYWEGYHRGLREAAKTAAAVINDNYDTTIFAKQSLLAQLTDELGPTSKRRTAEQGPVGGGDGAGQGD